VFDGIAPSERHPQLVGVRHAKTMQPEDYTRQTSVSGW
jgi:hypothetical protein